MGRPRMKVKVADDGAQRRWSWYAFVAEAVP